MNYRKARVILTLIGVAIFAAYGCSGKPTDIPVTDLSMEHKATIDMALPAGDYAQQLGTDILFMGTVWLDGVLPREVTAFSIAEQETRWRVEVSAPPLQAIAAGELYLIATSNRDGNGHLVALQAIDGDEVWDLALGNTAVAVTSHAGRVWVNSAQGIFEIEPQTGETIAEVTTWQQTAQNNDCRALVVYVDHGIAHLAASAGRDVFLYRETATGWESVWRFRAAKKVLELHPVIWHAGESPDILILGHSVVYSVQADGATRWRLDNNDLNRNAHLAHCGDETMYVVGNVLSGVYLVNQTGLVQTWELPGGAFRLGFIPLPIPANPNFGTTAADLNNDGQDEIIARSNNALFVFDCQATLLAQQILGEDQKGTLVAQIRGAPHYPPIVNEQDIIVASEGQVDIFSWAH